MADQDDETTESVPDDEAPEGSSSLQDSLGGYFSRLGEAVGSALSSGRRQVGDFVRSYAPNPATMLTEGGPPWRENVPGPDTTQAWIDQFGGDSPYENWARAYSQRKYTEAAGQFDPSLRNAENYHFADLLAHPGGSSLPNPLFLPAVPLYQGLKALVQPMGFMQDSSPAAWAALKWGLKPFFQFRR